MGALVEYVTNHFNDHHKTDLGQTQIIPLFTKNFDLLCEQPISTSTFLGQIRPYPANAYALYCHKQVHRSHS